MFQEFPKGLQKGDAWRIVMDAKEEAEANKDGYLFAPEQGDPPVEQKKRGRPARAKE